MNPYIFQEKAVKELLEKFNILWSSNYRPTNLTLKAPTGSGKTFMMADFLNRLTTQPNWQQDVAFVWITFSDDLAMQSRAKIKEYFFPNTHCQMLTVQDFNKGILEQNDILFLNWQKIVARNAADRVLRRPNNVELYKESGYYFEDVAEHTHQNNREIVLIIDESHTHVSDLAKTTVINTLNPRIIISVSATPSYIPNAVEINNHEADIVIVNREDVVNEGLIKEKIVCQTEEDLQKYQETHEEKFNQDEMLLDWAIEKRKQIVAEYSQLGLAINPLVLIQLPSETRDAEDTGLIREQFVRDYLLSKGIETNKIAYWLNGKPEEKRKLAGIENDNDPREFLLFKMAAGTGWDCPRAHVLVMYREIGSNTFYTQTLGRILRIPQPTKIKGLNAPLLKTGYLYTNYARNQVGVPDQSTQNKPFLFSADSKYGQYQVNQFLKSDFESRVDYGDLANADQFQKSLIKSFNDFFGIDANNMMFYQCQQQVVNKGININPIITNQMMVDAQIEDIDAIGTELKGGSNVNVTTSEFDLEKIFTLLCMNLLKEQTEPAAKITNISRSWSPLKSALRVWLRAFVNPDIYIGYKVFINDINQGARSIFRQALTKSLQDYRPILNTILESREQKAGTSRVFEISETYFYTDDYDEMTLPSGNCVLTPFYIKKSYNGKNNEVDFINFIDPMPKIKWWFKNGDYGQDYLAFKYFNHAESKWSLFYPDWLIQMKDGRIGIFDTKGGFTANPNEVKDKAEAMQKRIKDMNAAAHNNTFFGGIVIKENGQWYCNDAAVYNTFNASPNDWKPMINILT